MEPRIEQLSEKKMVGKRLKMTHLQNRTFELWRSFMPRRNEIDHIIPNNLYSIQVYSPSFNFSQFSMNEEFEKWAAVEVTDYTKIPSEMESFSLPGGLYAVFIHKGAASEGAKTFQYIFATWFPNSEYVIDARPHFELLGEKYKNEDPNSEEEIWIPIRKKS